MTAHIIRLDGQEAYDLIFTDHLAMLSEIQQDTMHRSLLNSSRVWMGMDDKEIIAMWGLIPPTLMSEVAYLWLYTTRHMHSHTFMFIRHSKRAVETMLEDYPLIVGHAALLNRRSRQWLAWLGAEFGEPINDRIIPFIIKAPTSWQQDSAQSA